MKPVMFCLRFSVPRLTLDNMNRGTLPPLSLTLFILLSLPANAQIRTTFQRVQPGYANAVQWRWEVTDASTQPWSVTGFKTKSDAPAPKTTTSGPKEKNSPNTKRPVALLPAGPYEIARGDALVLIANRSGIPVQMLKAFNKLESDVIRIGQIITIPSADEIRALTPPDELAPTAPRTTSSAKTSDTSTSLPASSGNSDPTGDAIRLQVYLDRRQFPAGPIDGKPGSTFEVLQQLYRGSRTIPLTNEDLQAEALRELPSATTMYQLTHDAFQFIAPPSKTKNAKPKSQPVSTKGRPTVSAPMQSAPQPIEERDLGEFMPYASSWEYVAERFHCDEALLRSLNPKQTASPNPGAFLKVPNVIPFEIEHCLDTPIQPTADPAAPVTAAIVDLSRLEIRKNDILISVMPLSRARPDLRGRNKWTILQALPGPAFTTHRVPRNAQTESSDNSASAPTSNTPPTPALTLPRGPRNPLGVLWIHLAKEGSTDPLPFGLHGTNIPSRMRSDESVGGFRLANWDIARAARMLPPGTPLSWLK